VAAPAVPAVTVPVVVPMGAIVALLLLHVPPLVVLAKVSITPEHMFVAPLIAAGLALTVTSLTAKQPVDVIL